MNWASQIIGKLLLEQDLGIEFTHIHQASSAVPDHSKNNIVAANAAPAEEKDRAGKTDENRNIIVGTNALGQHDPQGFMASDADYMFWMDDDTIPPDRAVSHLVNLGRPFVAGVYFLGQAPYTPLAYYQREDGLYHALYDYPKGTLVPVDLVGMGCTLIHKSVYQAILDNYIVYQRKNGSLLPVHRDDIKDEKDYKKGDKPYVRDGYYHMPIQRVEPDDNRTWPFYGMEYGRTEDHYFCEMAVRCGFQPWIDTNVECDHLKLHGFNKGHYTEDLKKRKELLGDDREIDIEDLGRRIRAGDVDQGPAV